MVAVVEAAVSASGSSIGPGIANTNHGAACICPVLYSFISCRSFK